MRRDVMSVTLFQGEAGHSLVRQNCHRDPARPVYTDWSVGDVVKGSLALCLYVLIAVLVLSGCEQQSAKSVTATEIAWQVGDCYLDKNEYTKFIASPSSVPPPPWEKTNPDVDTVHWWMLVNEWTLIDRGTARTFWQRAYSNRLDAPWFTSDGSLWTETTEHLDRVVKLPCPSRSLSRLEKYGIELVQLRQP